MHLNWAFAEYYEKSFHLEKVTHFSLCLKMLLSLTSKNKGFCALKLR